MYCGANVNPGHCSLWLEPATTLRALFPDKIETRLISYKGLQMPRFGYLREFVVYSLSPNDILLLGPILYVLDVSNRSKITLSSRQTFSNGMLLTLSIRCGLANLENASFVYPFSISVMMICILQKHKDLSKPMNICDQSTTSVNIYEKCTKYISNFMNYL